MSCKNILEFTLPVQDISEESIFTEDPDKIRNYISDESASFKGKSSKIFFPKNCFQVSFILQKTILESQKITISGAGTSITGSRVPVSGGWIMSMEKIRKIDRKIIPEGFELIQSSDFNFLLNQKSKRAIIPAGICLNELARALEKYQLMYPPDPTEMSAMLGGTVSTNASGARSYFYGSTRKWIQGFRVVLPLGHIFDVSRGDYCFYERKLDIKIDHQLYSFEIPIDYPVFPAKNAAGLFLEPDMDLVDLFIGHEGLLGVFTEIECKLMTLPSDLMTGISYFQSLNSALDFVDCVRDRKNEFKTLSLEFFDRKSLNFMKKQYPEIPDGSKGAVLFELEYQRESSLNPYPANNFFSEWNELFLQFNVLETWTVIGNDIESMKSFRHSLPEMINQFVKSKAGKLGTDMALEGENFRQLIAAYESFNEDDIQTVYFGHIGDFHLHLNFLPLNKAELIESKKKYLELALMVVRLGGTISAEHGVGKKTLENHDGTIIPYLEIMTGKNGLNAISKIKRIFDPHLILNIGNMVPFKDC